MNMFFDWIVQNSISVILFILIGLAVYFAGLIFLDKIVSKILIRNGQKKWPKKDNEKRQKTLSSLFVNLWRIVLIMIAGFTFIQNAFPNFNMAPLFASAGIIGVALGFGAQSLVKDFLSGIFIISENQYRVGDIIEIDKFSGTVKRIGIRSTVLRDVDGNVHYFPNGIITHVINKTMLYSMARFSVAVDPSGDIDQIINVINKIGFDLSNEEKWKTKIIEPPAFISVGEFTSSSVDLVIAGKTQPADQWTVTAQMRQRILAKFEKTNIKLAS